MPSVKDEKVEYENKLNGLLTKYSRVIFCLMDNVRSQQVHDVRRSLRGKAEFLMGKRTLQKKIINKRAEAAEASEGDQAFANACKEHKLLQGNSGLLFTNCEVKEIEEALAKFRIQAPARVGAVAPCEVIIPAGNTGLEPTMTNFFQALNIATKIAKGTVEIVNDKKVLSAGDKVDSSTAALLQKLKISPFYYAMEIISVWDRGVLFTKDDLKFDDATVEKLMLEGISNIQAMSLGAGIPTPSSYPMMLMDAFKEMLAVSVATDYEFKEYNGASLRADAKAGKLGGGSAPAASAPAGKPEAAPQAAAGGKAAKKPEPEPEEEDDIGVGGLF